MIRGLVAVVGAAALTVAVPSFAQRARMDRQDAGSSSAGATGGGPSEAPAPWSSQQGPAPKEVFVTGEVVMTTPSEVVLHTSTGMQKFALTPQLDEEFVPVEGETVTVGYVPAPGSVKATTVRKAAAANTAPKQVLEAIAPPSVQVPTQDTMTAGAPDGGSTTAEPSSSTPAEASEPSGGQHHRTELPKTASHRPLILLVGLSALAAAGILRRALLA